MGGGGGQGGRVSWSGCWERGLKASFPWVKHTRGRGFLSFTAATVRGGEGEDRDVKGRRPTSSERPEVEECNGVEPSRRKLVTARGGQRRSDDCEIAQCRTGRVSGPKRFHYPPRKGFQANDRNVARIRNHIAHEEEPGKVPVRTSDLCPGAVEGGEVM